MRAAETLRLPVGDRIQIFLRRGAEKALILDQANSGV